MPEDRLSKMLACYLGPTVLPAFAGEDVNEVYLNPTDSFISGGTKSGKTTLANAVLRP